MAGLSFDTQQLHRIFPFYIMVNEDMVVESCGQSLLKLVNFRKGTKFSELFTIHRPSEASDDFNRLKELLNQLIIVELKGEKKVTLRGQLEYDKKAGCIFFMGSPWFASMEQVKENDLNIHDFAYHDPLIDMLHVLKSLEITNKESGELITTINSQKNQLKILSQIVEDNINAIVITDNEGRITWVNKSFCNLTGYRLDEVRGKKPGNFMQGPETSSETVQYMRERIALGLPFQREVLNYSKTGRKYWVRIQAQPIYNKKNELTGYFAIEEDTTRERDINEKIRQSEAQFLRALGKIGDNVWEHDFRSGKTRFSKTYDDFLGLEITEHTAEQLWWENTHPDDRKLLVENDAKYREGGISSHNLEYRMVDNHGFVRWVLDRGVVVDWDASGKPMRIVGTHTDITRIKQTEIELENRMLQFKSLADNLPGVIYEFQYRPDGSEGFSYISPAFERILGIPMSIAYNYLNYSFPEDLADIKEKAHRSRTELVPFLLECRVRIPGGGVKWVNSSATFTYRKPDGTLVFTGFMMDITEKKEAENILRANEEKYRSIINNMNLGLLEVDLNERITFANSEFCKMSGLAMDELIGGDPSKLLSVQPEVAQMVKDKIVVRAKGIADAYEINIYTRKGESRWWLVSGAPKFDESGKLVGSVGIHLDITDQKNLEKELISAREKAEKLARAKDNFLVNMSHEIRTPMNAIMGMSSQLAKTRLDSHQQFYLEAINSSAENLLVIINDILDLSKINAGKLSLENIGFSPKQVGERAMQMVAHRAQEKCLQLTTSGHDPDISRVLIGDPYRLTQVLLNLLSNAVKFTDKGSVELRMLLVEDNETIQRVAFTIIDTGIGMDDDFVGRLFEKFSQENDSITRKYGGTGLGMSICKELVDLMGGTIKVISKKDQGTRVTVEIPFRKGSEAELPKQKPQVNKDAIRGKTVLVTDDNDMNRLVAATILRYYGAVIQEACNGIEALEVLRNHATDLVLMDIQMPEMNGYDATMEIRRLGINIPVVAMTANGYRSETDKYLAVGMNDLITKPFREDELLDIVSKWIAPGEPVKEKPLYDLSIIRSIGEEAFVKRMVTIFCDQTPRMVSEMEEAFAARDLGKVSSIAHKIKPSIDNLGISPLRQVVRDVDALGKEGGPADEIGKLLAVIREVINQVIPLLRAEIHDNQSVANLDLNP